MRILPSQQIDSNEGELKSPPSKRRITKKKGTFLSNKRVTM